MNKEFGLYIHWPFCLSKCPYCDFNSHVSNAIDYDEWSKYLLSELDYFGKQTPRRILGSVFFGGGTPSLMPPMIVDKILAKISDYWTLNDNLEITIEANPTSVESKKLKAFRNTGVNRVSLGIQSLENESLSFLGRQHSSDEGKRAIQIAADTFSRYSFDLIYARPNQTLKQWQYELKEGLKLAREHISLYQLTIEPGTEFHKKNILPPTNRLSAAFYHKTQEIMDAAKMPAYEISNHASPGSECKHNLNCWRGGDYVGIGPGAHGRLSIENKIIATYQIYNPERWIKSVKTKGHGTAKQKKLSPKERSEELIIIGLRTRDGVNLADFKKHTHNSFESIVNKKELEYLIHKKFLKRTMFSIKATLSGRIRLNLILEKLLV